MLVHKQHCKMLAFMRCTGSNILPAPDYTLGILAMLMQNITSGILSSNMSADPKVLGLLTQLREEMKNGTEVTWLARRVYPKEFPSVTGPGYGGLFDQTREVLVRGTPFANVWSTLHLVWGRFLENIKVAQLNSLKEPQEALPKELWRADLQEEIGVFPARVAKLIEAFSGEEFPCFKELLKIVCGGTLQQKCSFCDANMTVTAVYGEVEGCYKFTATVAVLPYMAPLFSCRRNDCGSKMIDKVFAHQKWQTGVTATTNKLLSSRCDYCFKLSEKVHRCSKCLTKSWCSRSCQEKDWEEKHKEFCIKGGRGAADQRKVKGGSQVRRDQGLKHLGRGMQSSLKLNKDKPSEVQSMLSEVKVLCQKKGKMAKTGTKVKVKANSGDESQKK